MSPHDEQNPTSPSLWKLVRIPALITIAFFVLQVIIQPLFIVAVPAGSVAVLAFGGSVDNETLEPGPHLKSPLKHAIYMKMWTIAEARETAPTDSNNQAITATVVPQIWIEPSAVPSLVRNYGDFQSLMKSVVDPQINQATRGQTSNHTPESLIWDRPKVVGDVRKALQEAISEQLEAKGVDRNAVHVGLVAITQFGFSSAVRGTLEAKAESQVRTHTATAQAKIRGIVADKDGHVTEILADGDATYAQTIAEANAYKVQKVGEANAAAPDVATYESIMKWLAAGGHSSRVQVGGSTPVIINGAAQQ
jgi:regulator of protease activity HflC (stomatin/prohibitin superfamily)